MLVVWPKFLHLSSQIKKQIHMIIVPIKDNEPIDKALKKFKKKFEKTGVVKELRARQAYEKPSVTRRTIVKKAVHRTSLQREALGEM